MPLGQTHRRAATAGVNPVGRNDNNCRLFQTLKNNVLRIFDHRSGLKWLPSSTVDTAAPPRGRLAILIPRSVPFNPAT